MTDELDSLSDAQLSDAFAVEVAGWRRFGQPRHWSEPKAATDANAVLIWLEKREWNAWTQGNPKKVFVGIYPKKNERGYAPSGAATFQRAACLALIRAKRAK